MVFFLRGLILFDMIYYEVIYYRAFILLNFFFNVFFSLSFHFFWVDCPIIKHQIWTEKWNWPFFAVMKKRLFKSWQKCKWCDRKKGKLCIKVTSEQCAYSSRTLGSSFVSSQTWLIILCLIVFFCFGLWTEICLTTCIYFRANIAALRQ